MGKYAKIVLLWKCVVSQLDKEIDSQLCYKF